MPAGNEKALGPSFFTEVSPPDLVSYAATDEETVSKNRLMMAGFVYNFITMAH
ncbi:hypothetical protein VIA_003208 [Vibrio orientalis CIP 102891 = ATCC 33934]|uniref:Uncharacterized protein n=1 Tax=Vibrio orientalis CIP 102891 = ATCC 33934 TaxID=675816 RepID=A0ABP2GWR7_VIBOR|nr:hypothetical protein VIA_003208 [Vibrio orientalis CIP 102891 = ATCC 33934]